MRPDGSGAHAAIAAARQVLMLQLGSEAKKSPHRKKYSVSGRPATRGGYKCGVCGFAPKKQKHDCTAEKAKTRAGKASLDLLRSVQFGGTARGTCDTAHAPSPSPHPHQSEAPPNLPHAMPFQQRRRHHGLGVVRRTDRPHSRVAAACQGSCAVRPCLRC